MTTDNHKARAQFHIIARLQMFLFIEADGRSDVKPVMKYLVLQHKPVLKVASAKLLTQSSVGWYLNSIHTTIVP